MLYASWGIPFLIVKKKTRERKTKHNLYVKLIHCSQSKSQRQTRSSKWSWSVEMYITKMFPSEHSVLLDRTFINLTKKKKKHQKKKNCATNHKSRSFYSTFHVSDKVKSDPTQRCWHPKPTGIRVLLWKLAIKLLCSRKKTPLKLSNFE